MFDSYEIIMLRTLIEEDLKQKFRVWQILKKYGDNTEIFAKKFNETFILLNKLNKMDNKEIEEEYKDMYKKVNS